MVQQDLDIQEYTDPDNDPMIPHTIVLKPGLVRPDWDLSAPGLRDAWDAGDLSPFHGWNKRAAATPTGAAPTG